jgi:retinol dehydrogenase-12
LDLADLRSIKAAAEEFMSKESELHVLFNNAGVMFPSMEEVTKDGYDLQFGTNVLGKAFERSSWNLALTDVDAGHFYFTKLLLPRLLSTAQTSPPGTVRVVNVSSAAAYFGKLNFNTFKDGPARKKVSKLKGYTQSKYVRRP